MNEQIGLQTIHTTFIRYHNVIALRLQQLNPTWNDEKIYQETRSIIAASLQHVTFNVSTPELFKMPFVTAVLNHDRNGYLYYLAKVNKRVRNLTF